jgi:hypothetical protein
MSPERFVKGESERTRKIPVDSAALTHQPPLDLCLLDRDFAPILRPKIQHKELGGNTRSSAHIARLHRYRQRGDREVGFR